MEFDLMLMDLHMPHLDGFEATAAIRKQETATGRRTPIIALTADVVAGVESQCLQAGMDGWTSKPIHIPAFVKSIPEVLEKSRSGTASSVTTSTIVGERVNSR
jgi:CheY-like chemotaxis protein